MDVQPNDLDQRISLLRRALGESAENRNYIVEIPGAGYKFVAEVETVRPRNWSQPRAGDKIRVSAVDEAGNPIDYECTLVPSPDDYNKLLAVHADGLIDGVYMGDGNGNFFIQLPAWATACDTDYAEYYDFKTKRVVGGTSGPDPFVAQDDIIIVNPFVEDDGTSVGPPETTTGVGIRRLLGDVKEKEDVVEGLEKWTESLPFPMASILRAWQATTADDFRVKHEHLLHFFEASAEFLGIILLSGFRSREEIFRSTVEDLSKVLQNQKLGFKRATFGTWKLVIEYLGKRIRERMSKAQERQICIDMFADPDGQLPEMLGRIELAQVISRAIEMRNDASHGGVLGQQEAQALNEQLVKLVHNFREAIGDVWLGLQLIQPLKNCRHGDLYENEVALLVGSNSEFLQDMRWMPDALDAERLYIVRKEAQNALKLLPLLQLGPSPSSRRNACYFFNRIEKAGLRYVSYHFVEQPSRHWSLDAVTEIGQLLEI
jgi:hypothetical protein